MVEQSLTGEFKTAIATIVADISKNPNKYKPAGEWLDQKYGDTEKVWHAIELRCQSLLDKGFKRQDWQESPSLIMPGSVLEICKVLQAVAVVDMGFLPDLEVLMSRYENEPLKSVYKRIDTRAKMERFLDKLFPAYREHQAELICDYHGLSVACEDLIEKHDKIGLLDKADNLKVCLLTWLICCPDLGAKGLNLTEFEKVPWKVKVGTESNPHRAKVLQILATSELLSKLQILACKASKDVDGAESQSAGGGGVGQKKQMWFIPFIKSAYHITVKAVTEAMIGK